MPQNSTVRPAKRLAWTKPSLPIAEKVGDDVASPSAPGPSTQRKNDKPSTAKKARLDRALLIDERWPKLFAGPQPIEKRLSRWLREEDESVTSDDSAYEDDFDWPKEVTSTAERKFWIKRRRAAEHERLEA